LFPPHTTSVVDETAQDAVENLSQKNNAEVQQSYWVIGPIEQAYSTPWLTCNTLLVNWKNVWRINFLSDNAKAMYVTQQRSSPRFDAGWAIDINAIKEYDTDSWQKTSLVTAASMYEPNWSLTWISFDNWMETWAFTASDLQNTTSRSVFANDPLKSKAVGKAIVIITWWKFVLTHTSEITPQQLYNQYVTKSADILTLPSVKRWWAINHAIVVDHIPNTRIATTFSWQSCVIQFPQWATREEKLAIINMKDVWWNEFFERIVATDVLWQWNAQSKAWQSFNWTLSPRDLSDNLSGWPNLTLLRISE